MGFGLSDFGGREQKEHAKLQTTMKTTIAKKLINDRDVRILYRPYLKSNIYTTYLNGKRFDGQPLLKTALEQVRNLLTSST